MGCPSDCNKKRKLTGTDKLKSILEGWKNVIWKNPQVEKIAHDRAEICAKCDCNDKGWCNDCGCPIIAKARSLSEYCDEWDEVDKQNGL